MPHTCPTPGPVAGIVEMTDPIADWCTCMLTPYIHCFCHIAAIAGFLMAQGYDAATAIAMAQNMVRQNTGMMGGMGTMAPMSPVAGMPGMTAGYPTGPR